MYSGFKPATNLGGCNTQVNHSAGLGVLNKQ